MSDLSLKERVEIDFWKRQAASRGPERVVDLVENFFDVRLMGRKLRSYHAEFEAARDILELGAGQGLATCLVKAAYPDKRVLMSDISEHAVNGAGRWEKMLAVELDGRLACRSYEIPQPDSSLDLVFAFKAAHHFVAHSRTLREVRRVLRPGGVCLYLYEPACAGWIHPLAHWRVNRKRPEVPEDVLRHGELTALARKAGLEPEVRFDTSLENRGFVEQNYYATLKVLPALQRVLPCTADFIFRKPS